MSASRFGYPNIKDGKNTNEQNMQNIRSFLFQMSDEVSQYLDNIEQKLEELEKLKNGKVE